MTTGDLTVLCRLTREVDIDIVFETPIEKSFYKQDAEAGIPT